jgi:predicted phage terminase large subunit-like protein
LEGARIGWVVPSEEHPSAAEAWSDLKRALAPAARLVSEERKRIELRSGGSVQVWSGYDPNALRGPYFDGVVVDECSLQHEKLWGALRPTLSDYGGWALLVGTVPEDAVSHWFARLHHYASSEAGRARGWAAWRLSSRQNPQLREVDLEEARETLGARVFLREYEAELVAAEGGVWKEEWFRFYEEAPAADELQQVEVALDAAWKTGVRNDYSSAQVWGKMATDYYLLGELHGRWESPELRRRVAAFRKEWAARYPAQAVPLVVEAAGGGIVALQELRAAVDFPVIEFQVKGSSKMARAEAVSPLAEAGKVWVPSPRVAPWVSEWMAELVGFPHMQHDDRCDAAAMALQRLKGRLEPARAMLAPRAEPDYGDGRLGRSWSEVSDREAWRWRMVRALGS